MGRREPPIRRPRPSTVAGWFLEIVTDPYVVFLVIGAGLALFALLTDAETLP